MTHRPITSPRVRQSVEALRVFGLGYPGASEDHPWGEIALKVGGKVFTFLGGNEHGGLGLSVKLPRSATTALDQPFAQPTGYGLGKHGWVSASFTPDETVPLELLRAWIDESYRAIAPKKLVAVLEAKSGDEASTERAAVRSKKRVTKSAASPRSIKPPRTAVRKRSTAKQAKASSKRARR